MTVPNRNVHNGGKYIGLQELAFNCLAPEDHCRLYEVHEDILNNRCVFL